MICREQMSTKCRKDYSSVLLLNLHPFFGLARENSSIHDRQITAFRGHIEVQYWWSGGRKGIFVPEATLITKFPLPTSPRPWCAARQIHSISAQRVGTPLRNAHLRRQECATPHATSKSLRIRISPERASGTEPRGLLIYGH